MRRWWPFALAAAALVLAFAAWWALLALIFAFGTCGEDSSIDDQDELERLCGDSDAWTDGRVFENLIVIGVAAVVAATVLTFLSLRRRSWWPLGLLAVVLIAAAALGWRAEDL